MKHREGPRFPAVVQLFCNIEIRASKPLPEGYPQEIVTLADRIKAKRLSMGMTIREAAKIIGVDESVLGRWERGVRVPGVKYYLKIEKF